ncbi:OLC1v1004692C1 [Oldenlandia corymbosa var. corymbosa]|uniref:OLC1v1004692C1 n=1 Tax=Oldenlandia corymbosa var. corymbosa TaxID=529605 RepID=A0AAV1DFW1_OLDCO|nr:OLC1v1004692C1 [Oldenlandia corymbosa var. corymbosa]
MLRVQNVCLNASMKDSGKVINAFHGCTSLVELYLVNCSVRNVSHIEFPSLKTIVLDHVELSDGESSALLFDGCSVIETLVLSHCEINMDYFCIGIPWLKNLYIRCCFINSSTTVDIDSPELESLYYVGMLVEVFEFAEFDHIRGLAIHVIPMNKLLQGDDDELDSSCYDFVKYAELVNPFSGVESLCLGQFSIEALYHQLLPLPKFCSLKSLHLDTIGMAGWIILGGLLENASNLETLHFQGFNMYEGGFASFFSSLNGVPTCLSSSLKGD